MASRGVAPAAAKADVPGLRGGAGSEVVVVVVAAAAAAAPVDLASEGPRTGCKTQTRS